MLLRSIKLQDFRQFNGEQCVSFSTRSNRNVTIIMGENGSGKTSFAQAFRWCLYGVTDFSDPILLSRAVSSKMLPGDEHDVSVEIELTHNNIDYKIMRRRTYKKDSYGRLSNNTPTKFVISYKAKDGNIQFIKDLDCDRTMKEILPADLSRYFFFDGERIEKMSKDIHNGKSKDIGEAVRSLLGLNAFLSSLKHLKTAINRYDDCFTGNVGDDAITRNVTESKALNLSIEKNENRLEELSNYEEMTSEQCKKLNDRIEKNKDSEELTDNRNKIKIQLQSMEEDNKKQTKMLLDNFNSDAPRYFPKKMIKNALELLKNADQLDNNVPGIHDKTIKCLVERGYCICGNHIEFGNEAYNKLIDLMNFIPPKAIGSLISDFSNACEEKTKSSSRFFETFKTTYSQIRSYGENKEYLESQLSAINEKLNNMEDVGALNQELMSYERKLREYREERDDINQRLGVQKNHLRELELKRVELSQGNATNRKIETYKAYASYLYQTLTEQYKIKETETRDKLANTINSMFKKIYNGGFSLSLDDKYNVILMADGSKFESTDDIETSTAQSISIIFAFIAGVIKMAKDNKGSDDGIAQTEPYPLVMDAPLSAFDKKRISTVCDVLPNVAEQVIIFIKDTDGDVANQYLGTKIGKKYKFDKVNEFETILTSEA